MKCFEKRLTFLLVITCVLLLFLPKINLITMAGQTAGLRIDDVCLLFAAGIMFLGYARAKRSWLSIEKFFFLFFSLSVFSVCINTLLFDGGLFEFRPNILYVMRFLEYFVFFYIG